MHAALPGLASVTGAGVPIVAVDGQARSARAASQASLRLGARIPIVAAATESGRLLRTEPRAGLANTGHTRAHGAYAGHDRGGIHLAGVVHTDQGAVAEIAVLLRATIRLSLAGAATGFTNAFAAQTGVILGTFIAIITGRIARICGIFAATEAIA